MHGQYQQIVTNSLFCLLAQVHLVQCLPWHHHQLSLIPLFELIVIDLRRCWILRQPRIILCLCPTLMQGMTKALNPLIKVPNIPILQFYLKILIKDIKCMSAFSCSSKHLSNLGRYQSKWVLGLLGEPINTILTSNNTHPTASYSIIDIL